MSSCPEHAGGPRQMVEGVVVCGKCGRPLWAAGTAKVWIDYTQKYGGGPRPSAVGGGDGCVLVCLAAGSATLASIVGLIELLA